MEPVHDDRSLFDRLCLLRALYVRRGEQDRDGTVSLVEAMRLAQARLLEPRPATAAPGS